MLLQHLLEVSARMAGGMLCHRFCAAGVQKVNNGSALTLADQGGSKIPAPHQAGRTPRLISIELNQRLRWAPTIRSWSTSWASHPQFQIPAATHQALLAPMLARQPTVSVTALQGICPECWFVGCVGQ